MNAFAKHMKPADVVAQLRMERQRHKGAFLLVEGDNDVLRFDKFIDRQKCSVVVCYGKENVLGAVDIEQNDGKEDVIGLADADFDRVLGSVTANDDIVHSLHHDFDIDVCHTSAYRRYLAEVGDDAKVAALGGCEQCFLDLLQALKPLSAMRYANQRHQLGYSLREISIVAFFDGHAVDINAMVDAVSYGQFSNASAKQALRAHIDHYMAVNFDLGQFTNGHDFICGLGIALRDRLSDRHPLTTGRAEVERHMRLTFDFSDLQELGLLDQVRQWEQRTGFSVMRVVN